MRKLFVATATVAIFALLVTPAMANNGKGGGGSTTTPSSIDVCEVDGVAVNACAAGHLSIAAAPTPHLGGSLGIRGQVIGSRWLGVPDGRSPVLSGPQRRRHPRVPG